VYDAWNRLVEVRADDSGEPGDLIAEYAYDGTNRRIEKAVTEGADTHYYYNRDWQIIEERQSPIANPQSLTSYVWSARYIDAPIVRFHDANGDGDYLDGGDNIHYYTGDANYNVTAALDAATGEAVDRYVYTAYGKATVYDEDWANPAAPTTHDPLYCGYFFDGETALYQVRNRYYDSGLSTFITRDPIGYRGGINLYEYVGDLPIRRTDPSGSQFPAGIPGRPMWPPDDHFPSTPSGRCCEWAESEETRDPHWLDAIPNCPCILTQDGKPFGVIGPPGSLPLVPPPDTPPGPWFPPKPEPRYHPDASYCIRSHPNPWGRGQQCCYDVLGKLITGGESAGTPDLMSPSFGLSGHVEHDVTPFDDCKAAGMLDVYFTYRPPNNGKKCPRNDYPLPLR